MTKLRFFTGRAASGHKDALYAAAIEAMRSGSEVIFVVPEQATYLAEQRLSDAAGGLIGLQVLSFKRLAERVLEETGRRRPYLDEQGVAMAARRVAAKHGEELKIYGRAVRQSGFCTELSALFGELRRAMITPEELIEKASVLKGSSLTREKLMDVALLYRETEAFIATKYMTEDDGVNEAIRLMPRSFVAGSILFVDFDGLSSGTRQFLNLFSTLLSCCKEVTCSVTIDPSAGEETLFMPPEELKNRLAALAASLGGTVSEKVFTGASQKPAVLDYITDTLFRRPGADFAAYAAARGNGSPDTAPVEIHAFSNCAEEAEGIADLILDYAKKGCRYRDMAVLCSDGDAYEKLLRRSFALRGIPMFADEKRGLCTFSAVDTLVAALRLASGAFRTGDMLRLAKSGFAGVDAAGAEALENYCLRYGIRPGGFSDPFTLGRKTEEEIAALGERAQEDARRSQQLIDEAEAARQTLVTPLEELKKGLAARTAGEKLTAVYRYLESIGLVEKLTQTAAELIGRGDTLRAAEHGSIWHMLTETLDQCYQILGDVPMSRDDFLSIMEEGLSGEVVRILPDTRDRVLVGDIMHTVPPETVRILFVAGAGEGLLPADRHDDGLLSNSELQLLEDCGLSFGTATDRRMALDRYTLYLALASAGEKLVFSHSMTVDGHESLMSGFLTRIQASTGVKPVLHTGAKQEPVSERMGFRLLADKLRKEPDSPETQALLAYYETRQAYQAHAEEMLKRSKGLVQPPRIEQGLSRRLFKEGKSMSVSRLEQFASCPFRHFLNYGLRARIRPAAEMKATDLGTFYHAVVERFVKTVLERGLDFEELAKNPEKTDAIVDAVIPEAVGETGDGMLKTDARLAAQIPMLTENVRFTCRAIVRQIAAGSYRPIGAEARFKRNGDFPEIVLNLGNGRTAILEGIIDRVDEAPGPDGKRLCRVIDYKTAGRKMEYENIEEGLHMQLPLYLYAVESAKEEAEAAGMYYVKISPAPEKDLDDAEKEQEEVLKQLRLTGITSDSEESLAAAGKTPGDISTAISGANVKKDGEPYANAGFCTPEQMRLFMRHVKRIAEEKATDMFDGNIRIDPAPKACGYCDFRPVCGFDPKLGCRVRQLKKLDRYTFLNKLDKEEKL